MKTRKLHTTLVIRIAFPCLLFVANVTQGATGAPLVEPKAFDVSLSDANATLEFEDESQDTVIDDTTQKQDTQTLSPSVGGVLEGSIYHPNFLYFNGSAQIGREFEQRDTVTDGISVSQDNDYDLRRYDATMTLLREKPYSCSLFGSKNELRYDYDFFTRTTVDNSRYGVEAGYRTEPVPVIVSFVDTREDTEEETVMDRHEDTVTVSADNRRNRPESTSLHYTFTQFDYEQAGEVVQEGTRNNVNLTDTQVFATGRPKELRSSLYFNSVDSLEPLSRTLTYTEQYNVTHTDNLDSQYSYEYSDLTSGDAGTRTQDATASLSHQLYESLQSVGELEGQTYDSSGDDTGLQTTKVEGGLSETYTKQLPAMSTLTLGASGKYAQENQESQGSDLSVIGERHTLGGTDVVLLDQPVADVSSIVVTDSGGTIRYVEGLDYRVTAHGSTVEIARLVGGSIQDGAVVLVDYRATSQPTQSFATVTEGYNVRLDLFNNFLAIYGRSSRCNSSGAETLTLEDVDQTIVGISAHEHWWEIGAENLDYVSTVSDYEELSSFQRLTLTPSGTTTASLNLDQAWTTYRDNNDKQQSQSYIGRIESQLMGSLRVHAEAGLRKERGVEYNFDSEAARAGIDFQIGKLSLKLDYENTHYTYTDERQDEQRIYLRARRTL